MTAGSDRQLSGVEKNLIRQLDGGEEIVVHGAGIDAYFGGSDERQLERGVAEDDLFAEIMVKGQEGVTHLAEGGQVIGGQGDIRFKAGVDKDVMRAFPVWHQGQQKVQVFLGAENSRSAD